MIISALTDKCFIEFSAIYNQDSVAVDTPVDHNNTNQL